MCQIKKYVGDHGGMFMPESLINPLNEVYQAFTSLKDDVDFINNLDNLLCHYAGRETPITSVNRFAKQCGGQKLILKREDLLHTGAHKINNALGQCLLAKYMGKSTVIAETGAGQHGVATATACARLGLSCIIYMGEKDIIRQQPNVKKMKRLGAYVRCVDTGSKTLKDAVNEALRYYADSYKTSYYCLGSSLGPFPYPSMVTYFQSVIGRELRQQCLKGYGRLPDIIIACLGGGSNAAGIFSEFIDDSQVKLIAVEAGGVGDSMGEHASRFKNPTKGILHGCKSYVLQDQHGQIQKTHSISAGLDYPMIGPQHAYWYDEGRVDYVDVDDHSALKALNLMCQYEGIIPALESSHALAYYQKIASEIDPNALVVVNLSGRGDKDLDSIDKYSSAN